MKEMWRCPACSSRLVKKEDDGVSVKRCPNCGATWFLVCCRAPSKDVPCKLDALEAEVKEAMSVLKPNMPENGLVDACRQVMQAKISAIGNCEDLEKLLAAANHVIDLCKD